MADLANIGPRGIRQRARLGGAALVAAAILFGAQTARDAPLGWTASLAPLLWLGGLGVLQARGKT